MLWGVSALKCYVFQKTAFSRFSIDRTCCSIDQKCDKKLGLNLPNSIGSQLVLDWSNVIFDRSNLFFWPIENMSEGVLKGFSHVLITLLIFFLIFLKGFCLQVLVRPYYPFFFILFTFFIHIRCNFRTYRFLGFFIFVLVSFKIDHWVFVLRCYKHVSHALIWSIWWFENNLKF